MSIDTYPPQNVSAQTPTLGYAQVTVDQTGISTGRVDLTNLSVTVTVPAGRRIRITGQALFLKFTSAGWSMLGINEGSTALSEAYVEPAVGDYNTATAMAIVTPSAGTHTYKLMAQAETATVDVEATAAYPAFILVEDITGSQLPVLPQSVPVGRIGYAENTALSQAVTTSAALAGLSVNVSVPAGRVLRITGSSLASNNTVDCRTRLTIQEGATQLNGCHLNHSEAGVTENLYAEVIVSPSAGAHTYSLNGTALDAGTSTFMSSAVIPSYISVEDITPTPAPGQGAPGSTLGYAEVTANQGSITTEVDLTGLTVTATVPAGRRIRVSGSAYYLNTGTSGYDILKIYQDGVQVMERGQAADTDAHSVDCEAILTPSAGTHTWKLRGQATGGTATFNATATFPAFILVEDITGAVWPVGSTVTAGMVASEQWVDYTPTLTQSATVTKTVTYARYMRLGRLIICQGFLSVTGAGTAANAVLVGLPVAAVFNSVPQEVGTGTIWDVSLTQAWKGQAILQTASVIYFRASGSSGGVLGSTDFTAALANTDQVSWSVMYEAAS